MPNVFEFPIKTPSQPTDEQIVEALATIQKTNIELLPIHVQAAFQQMALAVLQKTI